MVLRIISSLTWTGFLISEVSDEQVLVVHYVDLQCKPIINDLSYQYSCFLIPTHPARDSLDVGVESADVSAVLRVVGALLRQDGRHPPDQREQQQGHGRHRRHRG